MQRWRSWAIYFGLVVGLLALVCPSASFTPSPPRLSAPAGAYRLFAKRANRGRSLSGFCAAGSSSAARLRKQTILSFQGPVLLAASLQPAGRAHAGRDAVAGWRWTEGFRSGSTVVTQMSVAPGSFVGGDGFAESANENEWLQVSEGVTAEMAEDCSVEEAAGIAGILSELMESCNAKSQRLPESAGDVLQALLSHPAGSQAFWTTFLTDPDLDQAAKAPFEPALVRSIERFPELNIGVVSSCLAMSATEEALFLEEGDEFMSQSASDSKERALALFQAITRQPDPKLGESNPSAPRCAAARCRLFLWHHSCLPLSRRFSSHDESLPRLRPRRLAASCSSAAACRVLSL